jgi:hypothetical protein
MPKDSGTERAKLFAEHLNKQFPGSQTTWAGPPDTDTSYIFDMHGAGKRVVISERIFDAWGGSNLGLLKTLEYHQVDEHIANCPSGRALHIVPGSGEKPEFTIADSPESS